MKEKEQQTSGISCLYDKFNMSLIKKCLPGYNGSTNYEFWTGQLKNLSGVLSWISKLKRKALSWLQSRECFFKREPKYIINTYERFFLVHNKISFTKRK